MSLQVVSRSHAPEVLLAWETALAEAKEASPSSFEQWFSSVQFDQLHGGELLLTARDEFVRDWVRDRFQPVLVNALGRLLGTPVTVRWHVSAELHDPICHPLQPLDDRPRRLKMSESTLERGDLSNRGDGVNTGRVASSEAAGPFDVTPPDGVRRPSQRPGSFGSFERAPESGRHVTDGRYPIDGGASHRSAFDGSSTRAAARSGGVLPPPHAVIANAGTPEGAAPYIARRTRRDQLNPKYTFGNFVVGPSNELAHAAAVASAGGGGPRFNPLFICGGTGLGKTHLMHSIAHQVLDLHPDACVLYVSAERFTNQFIEALQHHKMEEFRQRYRGECDLLLVDDIQFLAGREQTQEEFFHTFNALHEADKPIVVSSDKYPQELQRMPERLISRFTSGLVADIQTPALETRVAIVRKKAQLEGIPLEDDVAVLLAQNVKSNVRELEGTLIRLAAKSSLMGHPIDLEFARREIAAVAPRRPEVRSVEDIQRAVSGHFRVSSADLLSKDRHKSVAFARQVAMYLCRQRLKCSFPELGRAFGNRDHTTVMSAVRRVEALRAKDPQVDAHLQAIESKLSSTDD